MYNFLLGLLIVVSTLMIITIMMQPSKQDSAANAFMGGAGELFGKQKARGFEAVMKRATATLGVLMFVLALALAYLSSH